MSSARLPLALAVLGLAACAHTPSNTTNILPDIRYAAPVVVKSSDDVPEGYDDHVVVSVDGDGLRQAQQTALAVSGSRYYYYGHPATRSSSPAVATSAQPRATRPLPSVSSSSAVPVGPRRSGNDDRHRSHD